MRVNMLHDHFAIRCRGVVLHEGKLLAVRHAHDPSFAVLPGGHLDDGEGLHECLVRELREELGVTAQIGRMLFVHTFRDKEGRQLFEFLFEVTNGYDFAETDPAHASHGHELAAVEWIAPGDKVVFRPKEIVEHHHGGTLISDAVRFLSHQM